MPERGEIIIVRCAPWVSDTAAEALAATIAELEGVSSARVAATMPQDDDE